ncbi:MAG: hypothetical protein EPN92_10570 [Chitinophagaceae bacterium]|nr:MAG: hypothetical protein EPN92_10570 [Chitinophagaceae bacterium]
MRKISFWASRHKWPARFSIVGIYIILNILGIITGLYLSGLNISIPSMIFGIVVLVFLAAALAYPSKRKNSLTPVAFYRRQKKCDFILVTATFCMIVYIGNHIENPFGNYTVANASRTITTSLPGDSTLKSYKSIGEFSSSLKDKNGKLLKWKERKKILKEQLNEIKKSANISDGGKIALILLSVLVAVGLLYLVAALSCNIACSGADGAAIIVLIVGAGLVGFLLYRVIRSITKKRKTDEPPKKVPATNEN